MIVKRGLTLFSSGGTLADVVPYNNNVIATRNIITNNVLATRVFEMHQYQLDWRTIYKALVSVLSMLIAGEDANSCFGIKRWYFTHCVWNIVWPFLKYTFISFNEVRNYFNYYHFVTEMCTYVHISVTKCCIVGHGTGELRDLWLRSIALRIWPLLEFDLAVVLIHSIYFQVACDHCRISPLHAHFWSILVHICVSKLNHHWFR